MLEGVVCGGSVGGWVGEAYVMCYVMPLCDMISHSLNTLHSSTLSLNPHSSSLSSTHPLHLTPNQTDL